MIALYRGTSFWPSKCIEWINWSPYSHAAYINPFSGTCVEAWPSKVAHSPAFDTLHSEGTVVDFFRVEGITEVQEQDVFRFMLAQVGKRYDYRGVFHFITRKDSNDKNKWFCSELVFEAYRRAGIDLLLRVDAYKVYPGMLALSPKLVYVGSLKAKNAEGITLPSETVK